MNRSMTFIFNSLSFCATILVVLLLFEYRSLMQHADKLKRLKEEYRMHRRTLKNVWRDYIVERKNVSLVQLNRSLEHLEQASLAHVDPEKQSILRQYLDSSQWSDYTEQALQRLMAPHELHKQSEQSARFCWPIEQGKFWLSSLFGLRENPNGVTSQHNGIDLAACKGTLVRAADDGLVERVYFDKFGYGNTILIKHDECYTTRYAHLDKFFVSVGQRVVRGMVIGHVGDTGRVRKTGNDASHLHFEVYSLGERIDPLYVLS